MAVNSVASMRVINEKFKVVEDAWEIVNRLFSSDAPVMKSQYFDSIRSNKRFLPEVQLWLDVFKIVCNEWLEYMRNPIAENFKAIKDLEPWMYNTPNFPLERIAEALFLAFQLDIDLFKPRFRMWLRSNRPKLPVKAGFEIEIPFESIAVSTEFYLDYLDTCCYS